SWTSSATSTSALHAPSAPSSPSCRRPTRRWWPRGSSDFHRASVRAGEKPCAQGQADAAEAEAREPHLPVHEEGEAEAAHEPGGGDPAREASVLFGEAERREIREPVIDEHGEGAERPGGPDVAEEDERRDGGADRQTARVGLFAASLT